MRGSSGGRTAAGRSGVVRRRSLPCCRMAARSAGSRTAAALANDLGITVHVDRHGESFNRSPSLWSRSCCSLSAGPRTPRARHRRPGQEATGRGKFMRLVIERGELLRALGHVTSVVERRTTIPILSNVLLQGLGSGAGVQGDRPRARGDRSEAPADVSQPGAVTVPAHMLHDIVRKLPDGAQVEITRDAEKERLTLAAGHVPLRAADAAAGGLPRPRRRRVRPQVRARRART